MAETTEPGQQTPQPPTGPTPEALATLKRIIARHKEYGFTPGNLPKKHLAELVEAGYLVQHPEHYAVSPLGLELYPSL